MSYLKDCRNDSGEGNRASQKAVRLRKKWVNKSYRKIVNQKIGRPPVIEDQLADEFDNSIKEIKRKNWTKRPDKPLGQKLGKKGDYKDGIHIS